jgi:hypothetical protein
MAIPSKYRFVSSSHIETSKLPKLKEGSQVFDNPLQLGSQQSRPPSTLNMGRGAGGFGWGNFSRTP